MEVSLFLILDYCFIETDSYRDAEAQKLGFVSGAGVHLMHVDRLILIILIELFIWLTDYFVISDGISYSMKFLVICLVYTF